MDITFDIDKSPGCPFYKSDEVSQYKAADSASAMRRIADPTISDYWSSNNPFIFEDPFNMGDKICPSCQKNIPTTIISVLRTELH